MASQLSPALETTDEVALHVILHLPSDVSVRVGRLCELVLATQEAGLELGFPHADPPVLRMVRITCDTSPKFLQVFCRAGHFKVVNIDDEVCAAFLMPTT